MPMRDTNISGHLCWLPGFLCWLQGNPAGRLDVGLHGQHVYVIYVGVITCYALYIRVPEYNMSMLLPGRLQGMHR